MHIFELYTTFFIYLAVVSQTIRPYLIQLKD